jgi:membrane-associated phospholipid phosphatase
MNVFKKILVIFIIAVWLQPVSIMAETIPSDSLPPIENRNAYKFKPASLILPASLIAVGTLGTSISGMKDYHLIHRKDSVKVIKIDNYMEYGMLGWVFVCDIFGNEKHTLTDQLCLVALAEGLNFGMTHGIKKIVNKERPDGGNYSFPSGHTANAFLGAHIAFKELKDSNPVLACSGYALALFVAGSRVYNNRHWVSDVVAGAGFGILSAEMSYLIYFPIKNALIKNKIKGAEHLTFAPTINDHGAGVYLSYRF